MALSVDGVRVNLAVRQMADFCYIAIWYHFCTNAKLTGIHYYSFNRYKE